MNQFVAESFLIRVLQKWFVELRRCITEADFNYTFYLQSFRAMSAIITNHLPSSNKNTEGSKSLLKELIGIVKECQTRYGGKTELATEDDQK